ncbi:MAG: NAD(P)H-hydrate epimerase [Pseudomonadota bacterium]|nr:NAD(P)H-hydrate epimerase [Pseudomonadota bacterium]
MTYHKRRAYSRDEAVTLEKNLIRQQGISTSTLIEKASIALHRCIEQHQLIQDGDNILCLVGQGHNGADTTALALLLASSGYQVTISVVIEHPNKIKPHTKNLLEECVHKGINVVQSNSTFKYHSYSIIIDGIFGITFQYSRGLTEYYQSIIDEINASSATIISIDTPSGLDADTGMAETAIVANFTLSIWILKRGLTTHCAFNYCGTVLIAGESDVNTSSISGTSILDYCHDMIVSPPRLPCSHKGDYGKVLVIGGDLGFRGAGLLASQAASFCGTGWTVWITTDDTPINCYQHPYIITDTYHNLLNHLSDHRLRSVVIGPGSNISRLNELGLLKKLFEYPIAVVVDANGLCALKSLNPNSFHKQCTIITTPHPGEAALLLGDTNLNVQMNRFRACRLLKKQYPWVDHMILKGAGTIWMNDQSMIIFNFACPMLAVSGTGDILAGLIAGCISRFEKLEFAVAQALLRHAESAKHVLDTRGPWSTNASELIQSLAECEQQRWQRNKAG